MSKSLYLPTENRRANSRGRIKKNFLVTMDSEYRRKGFAKPRLERPLSGHVNDHHADEHDANGDHDRLFKRRTPSGHLS